MQLSGELRPTDEIDSIYETLLTRVERDMFASSGLQGVGREVVEGDEAEPVAIRWLVK